MNTNSTITINTGKTTIKIIIPNTSPMAAQIQIHFVFFIFSV